MWKDCWIPGTANRRPLTPDIYHIGDTVVSNFLKENGQGWDRNLLSCVFWDCHIDAILRIPISRTSSLDVRRWFFSKSGYYTVKSAYYVARDLRKLRTNSATSSSNVQEKNWSFVWKLDIPGKIRVFLWRLLRNGLPVLQNLERCNIPVANLCPFCKQPSETILHTFQRCHFARLVWALSDLPSHALLNSCTDTWEWIQQVKQVLNSEQFHLFICIC